MKNRRKVTGIGLAVCFAIIVCGSAALGQNRPAFQPAEMSGVRVSLADEAPWEYTVSLYSGAKITIIDPSIPTPLTYPILWIGGVYLVSPDYRPKSTFLATGSDVIEARKVTWNWKAFPKDSGSGVWVAGWEASGDGYRLYTPSGMPVPSPASRTFEFSSLALGDVQVYYGFHIRYGTETAFFDDDLRMPSPPPPPIPEPLAPCLAGLGGTLLACLGALRRRRLARGG